MVERNNYGSIGEVTTPPNLIDIQKKSFVDFLQAGIPSQERDLVGFQAVFNEIFPIESYDGQCVLDFVKYEIQPPKLDEVECLKEGETYAAPLYVTFRLQDGEEVREEDIFMGDIPLMTRDGSFIINGAERVIVSQLHRSPGICFEQSTHANGSTLYSFRVIPDRGSWIEVQFDTNDLVNVYLDRKRRRRKVLAPTLFRALGYGTDEELLGIFYTFKKISLNKKVKEADLLNLVLKEDIIDPDSGNIIARRYEPMTLDLVSQISSAGFTSTQVIDISPDEGIFLKSVEKDPSRDMEEALKDIYSKLRPGDPPSVANAQQMLKRIFGDPRRYDLGRVGRYKIRQKLNLTANPDSRVLEKEDFVEAVKYLVGLKMGHGFIDDIDHLGSRRVRTVGELMEGQVRVGLARTERLARERMTMIDATVEKLTPQRLVNPKALSAVIKDFFGRSQLSQFMDQTNPLSELTHKRRLSALGPGGLSRERAGFEVRDVHTSHYGRICPIETPEGPNIGLISSLSTYARVNEFGFIESPYRVVKKGKVSSEVKFLNADDEERCVIAQANAPLSEDGSFINETVSVRRKGEFELVPREDVTHMDVSPLQMVSVATSLIPFLEHDDANRALMGSNMQRQAVPLLVTDRPYVGTGVEARVARDSGVLALSEKAGIVARATANEVIISRDGSVPGKKTPATEFERYELRKFMRTNAGTCANQKPIVRVGDKVGVGAVLADGAATDMGDLALGRNVLVAFMPWCGYNFEDAILINERMVKDDVYTSLHIEEFECDARDTKLGAEEITRDIPNVGEDALKNLDHDGIIRVGAEVKPGDILVGKITPKSETELAPEERLLRAIFGEKAADVRDTSLTVPSGTTGIVMDVKIASRNSNKKSKLTPSEKRRQAKAIHEDNKNKSSEITESLTEALSNILLGEKIPLDVINSKTDEIIIPANRKITKTLLRKLAAAHKNVEIDPSPIQIKIEGIISEFNSKFQELEDEFDRNMDRLESGDEVDPGVVKKVKVYVTSKKKLMVGDKMAGRHGNKGVIAKIVPEEDMPFLPDGTPVDIVLNPLGVPSRMNVGQVLETHLGWACHKLGMHAATPVFDGIPEAEIWKLMSEAGLPDDGKTPLFDGRTGEKFDQKVVVGMIYMLKLHHLVSEKIHARAVGPYSLVTQQPLGGKAQYGGQRFGEMEVWALEAYGAAYSLQEVLTVKSDDLAGRTRIYEAIVKGTNSLESETPESFNVLMKEMMALGLDIQVKHAEEG